MVRSAPPPFEVLEHTADVGLRARGRTLGEVFANAALGLAEILGRRVEGSADGSRVAVRVSSTDLEALLVDWLNEVLFELERREACLAGARVREVRAGEAPAVEGELLVLECPEAPEGTEVKAATYHQLSVRAEEGGYRATVYFDV
ncbi:MAG TPA: archease [Actinomycetota bacterium]|nr:archease [Actinomycetota bacterium]